MSYLPPLLGVMRCAGCVKPRSSPVPAFDEGLADPAAPVKGERELPWTNSGAGVPTVGLV
jgi:hypothetical protein